VAGSKKCSLPVSTASSSGWPGRGAERAETRAVHSDFPPARAETASSSSTLRAAAPANHEWSIGGAPIGKIAWVCGPSSAVAATVTGNRAQAASPWAASLRAASSKCDGRIPTITVRPR
jgi:hypothetical protein